MAALIPHLHQERAIEETFKYLAASSGSGLVVAPVAAGKSLIIAETIRRACTMFPETNCLVLTHVTELITQDAEHLFLQWPEALVSFYAEKLKKKSFDGQVIFASINSIYKKAYKIPHTIDLVFIDEAHLISPNAATMYRKFLADLLVCNPYIRVVGYTGTNFRATEGRLTEGQGRLFTDVIYQVPMLYLIEKGFLCPLITPAVRTKMSVEGVKSRNGDYVESQLQAAVDTDEITKACVSEIIEHGTTRNKWLVFTAGVEHCGHVLDELRARGVSCEMVTGGTPTAERRRIVEQYKNGDLRCLVNVGVFTTGFNNPAIDLMAFMRPTRSPVLYVQMAGRGMRVAPRKGDCLLLDFGGVIGELGPVDLVDAHRVAGSGQPGEAPVKTCPECHAVCFAGVRECQDCGYQFPDTGIELKKTASTMAVMSSQIQPEWHDVLDVSYKSHTKVGKNVPTMCVTYNTLSGQFKEWICYEHSGASREKAARWHKAHSDTPLPKKVSEAVAVKFNEPARVCVRPVGKYFEIVDCEFVPF